ncbi:hypothetical protein V6N13_033683 [Hibiscus sabdariffa]|uniref:Uncharacterized protein n=1 Tax=Hibiscus sabdariffa TaxID=183260 RepID=A0ABR2FA07_9ROSI
MLKSRYADTIFKAQQEAKAVDSLQKMKTSVDTQVLDLKKSVCSKPKPEAADCFSDSSKKRLNVVVHSTSIPQCPDHAKRRDENCGCVLFSVQYSISESFLIVYVQLSATGAARFSTSDKDLCVALC